MLNGLIIAEHNQENFASKEEQVEMYKYVLKEISQNSKSNFDQEKVKYNVQKNEKTKLALSRIAKINSTTTELLKFFYNKYPLQLNNRTRPKYIKYMELLEAKL